MVAEIGVRQPQAQEYRQPPKSRKTQGTDPLLESPKGVKPCQHLNFGLLPSEL